MRPQRRGLPRVEDLPVTRRAVVGTGLSSVVLVAAAPPLADLAGAAARREPFTLGVASGEPSPDSVVLWTRLAPDPLAEDGRGGMPGVEVLVRWEVAEDERFRRVVARGRTVARPRDAHAVHVEAQGLRPGREYFYRFRTGLHLSPVGRTRTAPARGSSPTSVDLAIASCAQLEHGYFTAYRRIAEDAPDLVVHLGDYLYEYEAGGYDLPPVGLGGRVRDHAGPEARDLAGYRRRHAQYKLDHDLQALHAAAPMVVVWDDHEVDNNWAAGTPEELEWPQPDFEQRRAAAFRAYWEHLPLRRGRRPRGLDARIYRRQHWGDLLALHLMDTRSYRDDQACGDLKRVGCTAALKPGRTMLGPGQEAWLEAGLRGSGARWDLLGQQVPFARRDTDPGDDLELVMDSWDGYPADRDRVTGLLGLAENPVVLTGDVHRHYAAQVLTDYDAPDAAPVAAELVTTSITSGGDGSDLPRGGAAELAANPHLLWASNRRGWVRARLTPDVLTADFVTLPFVERRGAEPSVAATYVVEAGVPGLTT
ncbi:alkaline phosphatase D family protein [Nocardioides bruguierae]|uniref:alkaline phosphatase D family protein n=1 Tax=Nocardioides bruguierae TaxID=2945102 RepID=UPI002022320B|nr:alkaline phosphatase D family protein [Nocardioides bruguierae]MCL8024919.1 alkaline phosphatase D family protein [Nocardioides bruguierae]